MGGFKAIQTNPLILEMTALVTLSVFHTHHRWCWATERPLSECSVMDKVTWACKEMRLNLVVGTKVTIWHHVTALLRPGSGCTTSALASLKEWLAGLPSLKDLQRVQGLSLNESDSKLGAQNL